MGVGFHWSRRNTHWLREHCGISTAYHRRHWARGAPTFLRNTGPGVDAWSWVRARHRHSRILGESRHLQWFHELLRHQWNHGARRRPLEHQQWRIHECRSRAESLFWMVRIHVRNHLVHLISAKHISRYAACIRDKLNGTVSSISNEWPDIASKIPLLHDPELDYNPQYDGYNLSIPIKQADVGLLGYPLHYANVNERTRRNNLHFYGNVTRKNGPAMTWSMHAIGHLDIGEVPSKELFDRTYVPYVRRPFYVWNEYVDGVLDGASNFITGAGGFLQLIMYGYAGIRINADSLTIERSTLPPQTHKLKLNGEFRKRICDEVSKPPTADRTHSSFKFDHFVFQEYPTCKSNSVWRYQMTLAVLFFVEIYRV